MSTFAKYVGGLGSGGGGGGGTPVTIGAYDSQTPSSNGLTALSNVIYAQSASTTNPGMIKPIGSQTLGVTLTLTQPLTIQTKAVVGSTSPFNIWEGAGTGPFNLVLGAVSSGSGGSLTTSASNVIIGAFSGTLIDTSGNTLVGVGAGNQATGTGLTYVGNGCGSSGTGDSNSGFGVESLQTLTSGHFNTSSGFQSGNALTTGSFNTILGAAAGLTFPITGNNNLLLGYNAQTSVGGAVGEMIVGSASAPITNCYFGQGFSSATAQTLILQNSNAIGTNATPGVFAIFGGSGTGSGPGGNLILGVYPPGSSGASLNFDVHSLVISGASSNVLVNFGFALGYQRVASATSGGSATVNNNTSLLVLHSAGTLATYIVTMPANPDDGQTVKITSNNPITALTVNANAGQTITGGSSSIPANGTNSPSWVFVLADTNWYPF